MLKFVRDIDSKLFFNHKCLAENMVQWRAWALFKKTHPTEIFTFWYFVDACGSTFHSTGGISEWGCNKKGDNISTSKLWVHGRAGW